MAEANRRDPDTGVRRFLTDLRRGTERRSTQDRRRGERRRSALVLPRERRCAADRRSGTDRRVGGERRRPLGEQFSIEDAQRIGRMVRNPDREAACPRCDGNLLLGPLTSHDQFSMQEVHCTQCRRNALLVEMV